MPCHGLGALREIKMGVMVRPHSGVSDFYRELGDLFGGAAGAAQPVGGREGPA